MKEINQFQLLGIAACGFAILAILMPIFIKNNQTLSGLDISTFLLIGAVSCTSVALLITNRYCDENYCDENFDGYDYFVPLGSNSLPGSNDCAKCKDCRTGQHIKKCKCGH